MIIIDSKDLNVAKNRKGVEGQLTFIKPDYLMEGTKAYKNWERVCEDTEELYFQLLEWGLTTDECEFILPMNCILKVNDE